MMRYKKQNRKKKVRKTGCITGTVDVLIAFFILFKPNQIKQPTDKQKSEPKQKTKHTKQNKTKNKIHY